MGSFSIYHWVILAIVVLVLFGGGGKISSLMGDFAKGIKSFKKSMAEDETISTPNEPQSHIAPPQQAAPPVTKQTSMNEDARMTDDHPSHPSK
ncbi:twin-arginine translocase TatA/TatE family subunit [Aristophania vespae]|uniref:twin-arginine translocase TatA/TatE family subunit n=1 Tax=Aristophania vespae TaxID=2697033 RepID=UPI002351B89D|nr:twin-arginine translocase TatA/TatE family subunit [Aristophania vespae]UMM64135.1 Sec-independent protein translocase protein TatA [Aristophania vespae]